MTSAPPPSLAVVLNPHAGSGRAQREWPRLRGELEAYGLRYCLIQQDCPAAALAAVRALPPEWSVATVGGDGTIAAVLPALIEQQRPLLVLPFGTGNDFAGALGLRSGDFRSALAGLSHEAAWVDALRVSYCASPQSDVQHAYCLNGLGMGFDAQLTAYLPLAPSWTRGTARYLWAALRTLRQMQPLGCQILVDSRPLYQGRAMLCALMNARSVGGGFQFNPDGDLQDGKVDVVLAGDVGRRQVPQLIAQVRTGRHLAHPSVKVRAAAVAELHWQEAAWLHIDGDVKGQAQWLRAEVLPRAVRLLHPL